MATERNDIHADTVKRVASMLRRRGVSVSHVAHAQRELGDLRTADHFIAVRGAAQHDTKRQVTHGKRTYHYRYLARHWNFHEHGRWTQRPDFWILVELDGRHVYVIPNQAVEGVRKTAHQHNARRHRGSWLDQYRDALVQLLNLTPLPATKNHRRAA